MPFNGNGILDNITALTPLAVDGDGCTATPTYTTLNCSCWLSGYDSCPATAPQFCRQCTKNWPKPLAAGINKVTVGDSDAALAAPCATSRGNIATLQTVCIRDSHIYRRAAEPRASCTQRSPRHASKYCSRLHSGRPCNYPWQSCAVPTRPDKVDDGQPDGRPPCSHGHE
jgi:hypothetical protein